MIKGVCYRTFKFALIYTSCTEEMDRFIKRASAYQESSATLIISMTEAVF